MTDSSSSARTRRGRRWWARQRAVEVYVVDRLDVADAYLAASAERTGIGAIVAFDRSIDRVPTVHRIEPG